MPERDVHRIVPAPTERPGSLLFGLAAGSYAVRVPVDHRYKRTSKDAHVLRASTTTVFASTGRRLLYQQRSKCVKTFFPQTACGTSPKHSPGDANSCGSIEPPAVPPDWLWSRAHAMSTSLREAMNFRCARAARLLLKRASGVPQFMADDHNISNEFVTYVVFTRPLRHGSCGKFDGSSAKKPQHHGAARMTARSGVFCF